MKKEFVKGKPRGMKLSSNKRESRISPRPNNGGTTLMAVLLLQLMLLYWDSCILDLCIQVLRKCFIFFSAVKALFGCNGVIAFRGRSSGGAL